MVDARIADHLAKWALDMDDAETMAAVRTARAAKQLLTSV